MTATTAVGLALVAAHVMGFVLLAGRGEGRGLEVELRAPLVAQVVSLEGVVPEGIRERVRIETTGSGPGLVRRTWSVGYRGGYERSVGAAQLVGPFQDPATPTCVGRVIVGQTLLDDGHAGPGTIAHAVLATVESELRGTSITGLGDYRRTRGLALQWARLGAHPTDMPLVGGAPGYLRVTLTLVFDRVDVPLVIAMVPQPTATTLAFEVTARASLDFDNRVAQWLSNRIGGDAIATRFARRELATAVIAALGPPPPLELGDGATLALTYCGGEVEIVDGGYGALPFGVQLGRVGGAPQVLPPRHGPGPRAPVPAGTALAIDLDLDALNAMLYELWRIGFLDRRLRDAGLDRRFNGDPIVTEYLSLRISPPVLALPPVLAVTPAGGLRLAADARITIADGALTTIGRVWGAVDLSFVSAPAAVGAVRAVSADLGALELACEQAPASLVPCYADLVTAIRGRGAELHGALTQVVATLLGDLFAGRHLGAPSLPAELVIDAAHPMLLTARDAPGNATLRLILDARSAAP